MVEFSIENPGWHFIKGCDVKRVWFPVQTDYPYTVVKSNTYENLFYALKACFKLTGHQPRHDLIERGNVNEIMEYIKVVNQLLSDKEADSYFTFNGVKV